MTNEKFVMSFSGGKDSTLALYRMIKRGYIPVALLTAVKKNEDESWTHGLNHNLLKQISESLNVPLIKAECNVCDYEKTFEKMLLVAKDMGATICAYGDIDIKHHKQWGVDRCEVAKMKAEFPLWQESREELVYEFIDSGFTTIINKVNLNNLGEEFLGKKLTREVVNDIKKAGSDPCGENGEYHTFVIDGPLFKKTIDFKISGKVIDNGYGHLHIL